MRLVILGSAAGGGVPQWNCACDVCQAARCGDGVKRRTQDSVAISADGDRWFLLNASPDVARQIETTESLRPRGGTLRRQSPAVGVVLTNGDLDHCLGLLSLREWTPFSLYATEQTRAGLVEHNVVFRTLNRGRPHVVHRGLELDVWTPLVDALGEPSGLRVRALSVAGKVPLHLESLMNPSGETNIGLLVEDGRTGDRVAYVPGAASLDGIAEQISDCRCLLFDGTFWSDGELVELGLSGRTARSMAHLPVGGPTGSLNLLSLPSIEHRIYTHINNTNPMLREGTRQRRAVETRGWRIAEDGLEVRL